MSVDSASYPVWWTIFLLILERWCKWDDQVIILEVVTQKKKIRGKSMNEGLPDIKQQFIIKRKLKPSSVDALLVNCCFNEVF